MLDVETQSIKSSPGVYLVNIDAFLLMTVLPNLLHEQVDVLLNHGHLLRKSSLAKGMSKQLPGLTMPHRISLRSERRHLVRVVIELGLEKDLSASLVVCVTIQVLEGVDSSEEELIGSDPNNISVLLGKIEQVIGPPSSHPDVMLASYDLISTGYSTNALRAIAAKRLRVWDPDTWPEDESSSCRPRRSRCMP